jgi:hypothetical protein
MNPLQERFAALRTRLRLIVTVRGLSWVLALLFVGALLGGWIDWRVHLPSLVRAFLLVGVVGGAIYLIRRYLLEPLSQPTDDLSLALQVEKRYPVLNDSLASAVQFLQEGATSERSGSPALRLIAVKRALHRSKSYDFLPIVDSRGTRAAGLSVLLTGTLAIAVAVLYPQLAWTGFIRLAHPFGGYDWPRQTHLKIEAKSRVGRGEAYQILVHVDGIVPERATVDFRFEGAPGIEQVYEITQAAEGNQGSFAAGLDGTRMQRNLRFQVRANDAQSSWQEVTVLPPPQLVPLDGRASPQIDLEFPAYSDQPVAHLPDGSATIEAIAGTTILLRAAVDRPLAKAWLEFPAETDTIRATAAHLAPPIALAVSGANQLGEINADSWKRVAANFDPTRQMFNMTFVARASGTYSLQLEDEMGLVSTRLLDVRAVPDPAPVVELQRPSRAQDSLEILPNAEITLKYQVNDPIFAIRSIYVDYRIRRFQSDVVDAGRMSIYDHELFGRALPQLLSSFATDLRLRPQHLEGDRRWNLSSLELKQGDILALQICADDFDDVTALKQAGQSHEIELRVVDKNALEISLNEQQAQLQQELLRLQKQQQEATEKVLPVETRARTTGERLKPEELDQLMQAEQLQQQVRSRVGTREEGLRAETARVLQTLRDNQMPRTGTQDRMEAVLNELDRLARQELEQIEPQLTEARKLNEIGSLPKAGKQQENQRQEQPGQQNGQNQRRNAQENHNAQRDNPDAPQNAQSSQRNRQDSERGGQYPQSRMGQRNQQDQQSGQQNQQGNQNPQQSGQRNQQGNQSGQQNQQGNQNPQQSGQRNQQANQSAQQNSQPSQQGKQNATQGSPQNQQGNQSGQQNAQNQERNQQDPGQKQNPLTAARKNQEEVSRTLSDLLKLMEPWSTTREVKGEARSLLQEQRRLQDETNKLSTQLPTGENSENLTPAQRGELEKASEQQSKLAERTNQLLDKLDRLAQERQSKDPETAKALQEAAQRGKSADAAGKMQEAEQELRKNQLGQASRNQEAGSKALEDMVKALEDRREDELERLAKKMKEAEAKLDNLIQRQQELNQKSREAEQMADGQKREEELKRLSQQQEELRKELQEQVRELSRMRADQASQSLSQAGARMQQGGQQMEQGQKSEDQQREALDRLNEAKEDLQDSQDEVEEQLARERMAKLVDQIRALKERQEPMTAESGRLNNRVLEEKQWTRDLSASMNSLGEAQRGLSEETIALAKQKLEDVKVFSQLLTKSGDAMREAAERMTERLEKARKRLEETPPTEDPSLDVPAETQADAETRQLQQMASRRIDQLLDAMKSDSGRRGGGGGQSGGGSGGGGGGGGGGQDDGVPYMAQLKVLRALQEDLNDRTKSFAKKNPDVNKLSSLAKDEFRRLQQEQQELTELFNELTAPEGDEDARRPAPEPKAGMPKQNEGQRKDAGKKDGSKGRP